MKYAPFSEQPHTDAGSLSLTDIGAQLDEQSLDVPPWDVAADRAFEDCFESSPMAPLHGRLYGTTCRYRDQRRDRSATGGPGGRTGRGARLTTSQARNKVVRRALWH